MKQSAEEIARIRKYLEGVRDALCAKTRSLNLPRGALDSMIAHLGGKRNVAEMTGRQKRVCDGVVERRVGDSKSDFDEINLVERRRFMNGDKLVAIISDAASTGISLHADRGCKNQRRRVHITLELAWSAEKAIQQLGRSHRSNASSSPSYELVVSDLAGETRFVSAVARRLESLGAITRGDRRAASALDLSQFNYEGKYGQKALKLMYERVVQGQELIGNLFTTDDVEYIDKCTIEMGLATENGEISSSTRAAGVKRFLARLLGLKPQDQNKMLSLFGRSVEHVVSEAKRDGTYDDGIVDLKGEVSIVEKPRVLINEQNNTKVTAQIIRVDRGVSFLNALKRYSELVYLDQGQRVLTREHGECNVVKWNENGQIVVRQDEITITLNGDDVVPMMKEGECPPWRKEEEEDETYKDEDDDDVNKIDFKSERKIYDMYIERQRLGFYSRTRTAFGRELKNRTPWITLGLGMSDDADKKVLTLVRPNSGVLRNERSVLFPYTYNPSPETVAKHWHKVYHESAKTCHHGPNCKIGTSCTQGMRMRNLCLISGTVTSIWSQLRVTLNAAKYESALSEAEIMREDSPHKKKSSSPQQDFSKRKKQFSQSERTEIKTALRVVRAVIQNGRKVVGVRFPIFLLRRLESVLYVSEWKRTQRLESYRHDASSCPEFGSFDIAGLAFAKRGIDGDDSIVVTSSDCVIECGSLIEEFRWRVENNPRYDEYVQKLRSKGNQSGGGRVGEFIGLTLDGLSNEIKRARKHYFDIRRRIDMLTNFDKNAVKLYFEFQFRSPLVMKSDASDANLADSNDDEKVVPKAKRRSLVASQKKMTSFFMKKNVVSTKTTTSTSKRVSSSFWSCPQCTLENESIKRLCDACGYLKPLRHSTNCSDDSPSFRIKKKKNKSVKRKRIGSSSSNGVVSTFLSKSGDDEKEKKRTKKKKGDCAVDNDDDAEIIEIL